MLLNLFHDIFFTSPILSPFISGKAISLDIFFILFDLSFWKSQSRILSGLLKSRTGKLYIALLFIFFAFILLGSILNNRATATFRFLAIGLEVLYIRHGFLNKKSFLWLGMLINYFLITIQFSQLILNFSPENQLSPTNISSTLYGDFSRPTFEDSQEGYFLNFRVGGLSTEAGFMASLIISTEFIRAKFGNDFYFCSAKYFLQYNLVKIYRIFTYTSYIFTFSKVSPVLILYITFKKAKVWSSSHLKPRFPIAIFVILAYTIVPIILFSIDSIWQTIPINTTFYDRAASFRIISDFDFHNLIFGVSDAYLKSSSVYNHMTASYVDSIKDIEGIGFAGVSSLIVFHGLIVFLLYCLICQFFNPDLLSQFFFLLAISNVTPSTVSSFVPCYYFFLVCNREFIVKNSLR